MDSRLNYFLSSPPSPGSVNMAVDAFLLEESARLKAPILRVYSWLRPTLSLGYFQKLEEVADAAYMTAHGVDCVKRPTGGGAILHHLEVTLSLSLPDGHLWLKGSVDDSYKAFAAPVLKVLRGLGVEAGFRGECKSVKTANCFAGSACADLVVDGKKVFGAAQRRRGGGVLTHASLLLEVDEALWWGVYGSRLGEGYAGVGHAREDWGGRLRRAYAEASGQAFVENQEWAGKSMDSLFSGQSHPPVLS